MTAVLLALGSAAAYGLSDFVGGTTSKRAGPWSVALVAQLAGGLAVLVLALALGGDPTGPDLGWALVAGVANGIGTGVPLPRSVVGTGWASSPRSPASAPRSCR